MPGQVSGEVKLCAVSVDLDEIPFYYQIHGLAAPSESSANAVFDVALGRLDDFARAAMVPLTLFTIGSTLEREGNGARLRALFETGHEIGNHTFSHRYDLTRLPEQEMRNEIERGQEAIERAIGKRAAGFRAPGYTVTDELLALVERAGFAYDSSVFPCPAYWAAKKAILSLIALRGRTSHSIPDTINVLRSPTRPYRLGRPYWKKGNGLVELPIQVTRGARFPFIGTSIAAAGPALARGLAQMVASEPLVNLELHGIDALDAGDGLESLAAHQRDLKIAHARKLEAFAAVVETLRKKGYSFVRLDEAARTFAARS